MQDLSSKLDFDFIENQIQLKVNEWDASQNWRFLQNTEKKGQRESMTEKNTNNK